uniref:Uncharacterized protein n=1 Tax=Anopheles coluzzii TaxID=1518534 RepID=A0A8W7PWP5_ANOCL
MSGMVLLYGNRSLPVATGGGAACRGQNVSQFGPDARFPGAGRCGLAKIAPLLVYLLANLFQIAQRGTVGALGRLDLLLELLDAALLRFQLLLAQLLLVEIQN